MIDKTKTIDLDIINTLRSDARVSLRCMSEKLLITSNKRLPASTLFDRIRIIHKNGFIKKYVSLIDFSFFDIAQSYMYVIKKNDSTIVPILSSSLLMRYVNMFLESRDSLFLECHFLSERNHTEFIESLHINELSFVEIPILEKIKTEGFTL